MTSVLFGPLVQREVRPALRQRDFAEVHSEALSGVMTFVRDADNEVGCPRVTSAATAKSTRNHDSAIVEWETKDFSCLDLIVANDRNLGNPQSSPVSIPALEDEVGR